MPDRTVLIDAGWFVGRWRRHLYAKRGLLARILAGVANGNCDPEKGIRAGRRAITQDLKYLAFRFRQFGLSSADVIVCYDGTLARQRRGALLETYKGNRIMIHPEATEKEAEEIIAAYRASESTIQDMRDHFTNFRFPVSLNDHWSHRYIDTHEADDLIADYVAAAPADEHITIVSADSDLVQLLVYPNVRSWTPPLVTNCTHRSPLPTWSLDTGSPPNATPIGRRWQETRPTTFPDYRRSEGSTRPR